MVGVVVVIDFLMLMMMLQLEIKVQRLSWHEMVSARRWKHGRAIGDDLVNQDMRTILLPLRPHYL